MKLARLLFAAALVAFSSLAGAQGFDHSHAAWNALMAKHVKTFANGNASAVDYAAIKAEHAALKGYLGTLTAVSEADYGKWSRPQRLAFLINAYNAYTVELILTKYPSLNRSRTSAPCSARRGKRSSSACSARSAASTISNTA
jgi:hypothetical protein